MISEELCETFLQSIPDEEKKLLNKQCKTFHQLLVMRTGLTFWMLMILQFLFHTNFKKTLYKVAHKEIIQDSAYISECWNKELKKLRLPPGGIKEVLCNLFPPSKKVIAAFQTNATLNKREQSIFAFLKKYICNCSDTHLKQFLRFCTGMILPFTLIC